MSISPLNVFKMYSPHMGNMTVEAETESPIIKEPSEIDFLARLFRPQRRLEPLKALNAAVSLSQNKQHLVITLVNQSLDEDLDVRINLVGDNKVYDGLSILLNSGGVRAYNDFNAPENVKVREEKLETRGESFTCKAEVHSINTLVVRLK